MSTAADAFRAFCFSELGADYEWGEVPVYEKPDGDPRDSDCSGLFYAAMRSAGVHLDRMTANDYYHDGTRIPAPTKVGDFGVMLNAGTDHAHHIVCYVGKGQVVEARGEAWGVVQTTVAKCDDRGAVWCRLPGVNLGELTDPHAEPKKYSIIAVHADTDWLRHHVSLPAARDGKRLTEVRDKHRTAVGVIELLAEVNFAIKRIL